VPARRGAEIGAWTFLRQALFTKAGGLFVSRLAFGIYDEPRLSISPFVFFLVDKPVLHPAHQGFEIM
jgi:hypothetical protein